MPSISIRPVGTAQPNPFDQFDEQPAAAPATAPAANPFDQFDAPPAAVTTAAETAAASTPAPTPSLTDTIMSGADSALGTAAYVPRGVRRGVANIAGFPVDAMNAGLSLIGVPVSQKPVMGSKYLDDALGGFGMLPDIPPPSTAAQRVLGRVGEEVGAAAVPVGAAVRAGKMGVEAARKLPLLSRMFVEPAALNPGAFTSKEMASAAAAGTGAAVVNEATHAMGAKDGGLVHNSGDLGGAVLGAGTLGIARTAGPMIGDIFNAIFRRGKFSNDIVKQQVTDILANSADSLPKTEKAPIDTQPLVDTIMSNPKVSDTIPGFQESLADRTRDPGLAALEYSQQTGKQGGLFTQQRNANTEAVDAAMSSSAPNGNPGALRSELETERSRQLGRAREQTATAQANLDQHLQRLQPALTGEGRGANIRTALEGASDRAREIVDAAWAPLNNSGQRVDMAPLAEDFGRVGRDLSVAERERFQPREADIPRRLSGDQPVEPPQLDANGQPVTESVTQPINEVTGLRNALTDAAREAGTAGRTNEARVINRHVEALDNYLDQAVPADLREQYDAARAATRDYHERFTRPRKAATASRTAPWRRNLSKTTRAALPTSSRSCRRPGTISAS
jgi:hypothetical protein